MTTGTRRIANRNEQRERGNRKTRTEKKEEGGTMYRKEEKGVEKE